MFSSVVNKKLDLPLGDAVSSEPAFLPKEWNRYVIQAPAKDVKELIFSWVLPWQGHAWRSKPCNYASHLVGHEGPGSITAVLKSRGLIAGCSSGRGGWIEGAFSLLNVTFQLTDKGVNAVQEIGDVLFTYLSLLRKAPVERWIFDECQKLQRIKFKFGEDSGPFRLASRMSNSLQQHPASEVLAAEYLLYDFEPATIVAVLEKLTLEGVRVRHVAKVLEDRCTESDTSYSSPVAFVPLEQAWVDSWSALSGASLSDAQSAASAKGLFLPTPNPFVPEDLDLKAFDQVQRMMHMDEEESGSK
jgi:insulysin